MYPPPYLQNQPKNSAEKHSEFNQDRHRAENSYHLNLNQIQKNSAGYESSRIVSPHQSQLSSENFYQFPKNSLHYPEMIQRAERNQNNGLTNSANYSENHYCHQNDNSQSFNLDQTPNLFQPPTFENSQNFNPKDYGGDQNFQFSQNEGVYRHGNDRYQFEERKENNPPIHSFDAKEHPYFRRALDQVVNRYGNDESNVYLAYLLALNQPNSHPQNSRETLEYPTQSQNAPRRECTEEWRDKKVDRYRTPQQNFGTEKGCENSADPYGVPQRLTEVREGRGVRKRGDEDRRPNWDVESSSYGGDLPPRKTQLSEPRHLHTPNSFTAFPSGKEPKSIHSVDPVRLSTFSVIPGVEFKENMGCHLYPEVNKNFEGSPERIPKPRIEEMNVDWSLKEKEKEGNRQEIVVKVPEKEISRERLDVKIGKEKAISSEKGEEISPDQQRIDKTPLSKSNQAPIPLNSIKFDRRPCSHPPIPLNSIKFPAYFHAYVVQKFGAIYRHQFNHVRKTPKQLRQKGNHPSTSLPKFSFKSPTSQPAEIHLKISVFPRQKGQNPNKFRQIRIRTEVVPSSPSRCCHNVPLHFRPPHFNFSLARQDSSTPLPSHRRFAGAQQLGRGGRRAA